MASMFRQEMYLGNTILVVNKHGARWCLRYNKCCYCVPLKPVLDDKIFIITAIGNKHVTISKEVSA